MKKEIDTKLNGLKKSFSYAFRGLESCIQSERNMRIHIVVSFFVLLFAPFYHFSKAEFCLLCLAIGSVICAEMLNTAIEEIVDMIAKSYSGHAKRAKDIAAGGVFVTAFFAAIVGIVLFFDIDVILKIVDFFVMRPAFIIFIPLFLFIGIWFIFKWKK